MKLSHGLAAVVLALSAAAAQADVSATITAVSDYDFRGLTQTRQNPALQGSVDITGQSGWYLGAWASNVDFGGDENIEVDLYGGFAGGETFPWDVGIIDYTYPQSNDLRDFPEIYASLGWKWLKGKVWYSDNFGGSRDNAFYYEGNAAIPLPANFGLNLHAGYSDGDYWSKDKAGIQSYLDWSVGVTYAMGHFNLGLKWVDGSDYTPANNAYHDIGNSDARAIFSISTTFPWSKEEATPEIAEAAPVAAVAAVPADADGDGVPDSADRCPNTPAGDRVGPNGCSCDVSIQTHFAFDSAELTAEDKAALDRVAARLQELEFVGGAATGYTDNTGDAAYNVKLSERRAQAVVDYLGAKGVAPGRITATGAGSAEPVADNATEEGRAQNRRVTIRRTDCGPAN
jgi:uncharacterized protein (TIGR02001 family)